MDRLDQRKAFFDNYEGSTESAVITGNVQMIIFLRNADKFVHFATSSEILEPSQEGFSGTMNANNHTVQEN